MARLFLLHKAAEHRRPIDLITLQGKPAMEEIAWLNSGAVIMATTLRKLALGRQFDDPRIGIQHVESICKSLGRVLLHDIACHVLAVS